MTVGKCPQCGKASILYKCKACGSVQGRCCGDDCKECGGRLGSFKT